MATLSLGQAAKLAGIGKTTLTRAIKAGRISAERLDDGSYRIDPSELARVYPVTLATPETVSATGDVAHRETLTRDTQDTAETLAKLAALDAQIEGLKEIVRRLDDQARDLREDRDQWRAQAENATRLLTDQRPRPWWRRLVG
jgi:excisionase family DNA binding protein